jgi:hypothetical protein
VRHCLEQALDLPKNVSEQAKRDLGNSPSIIGLGEGSEKLDEVLLKACIFFA